MLLPANASYLFNCRNHKFYPLHDSDADELFHKQNHRYVGKTYLTFKHFVDNSDSTGKSSTLL